MAILIPKLSDLPKVAPTVLLEGSYVPEVGIKYDVKDVEYFKWDCFQKSAIPSLQKSPKHYWHMRNTKFSSAAMNEGNLLECLTLEPHLFRKYFVVPDKTFPWKKKETKTNPYPKAEMRPWSYNYPYCQDWKKEMEARGKIVTSEKIIDKVIESMKVMATKKTIMTLLDGHKQVCLVWVDPLTGVRCKARLDILNNVSIDENIVDLKKTKDASWSDKGKGGFKGEIEKYGYYIQDAFYSDGYEVLQKYRIPFIFVAVEIEPPYECASYALREDTQIQGRIEYRLGLEKYQEMILSGENKGYPDQIVDMDIPPYKLWNTNEIESKYMQLHSFEEEGE